MISTTPRRIACGALSAAALLLAGCATPPQPLYQWENYQPQVYQYLKGQTSGPQEQIAVLEKDFQKIRAQGHTPPPGFHAHLGMLYAAAGKDDQAVQEFQTEKTLFPEATTYMDMFLARAKSQDKTQTGATP